MKLLLTNHELEISDITNLKEFNDTRFVLDIDTTEYEIKGSNLVLKEVLNQNTSIKITGEIHCIRKMDMGNVKEKKGFLKKLFS